MHSNFFRCIITTNDFNLQTRATRMCILNGNINRCFEKNWNDKYENLLFLVWTQRQTKYHWTIHVMKWYLKVERENARLKACCLQVFLLFRATWILILHQGLTMIKTAHRNVQWYKHKILRSSNVLYIITWLVGNRLLQRAVAYGVQLCVQATIQTNIWLSSFCS